MINYCTWTKRSLGSFEFKDDRLKTIEICISKYRLGQTVVGLVNEFLLDFI